MWETQVWSLGQEDTLEKEMVIHSSIFAWRIPRQRSLVAIVWDRKELGMTEQVTLLLSLERYWKGGKSF